MTVAEARAALERGRHVVLVTPPAPEQAGVLWQLLESGTPERRPGAGPVVPIVCDEAGSATEWPAAAPADRRVHAVTGLARAARLLREGEIDVLTGAVKDLAALVARSALKLAAADTVVVAWPETFATGGSAAGLDALLAEAREARRIVLSWNPTLLGDFLERHARRALVVGTLPVDDAGQPARAMGPARYAIVPPDRRRAAVREALDVLDPKRPLIWSGEAIEPAAPAEAPDAVLCTLVPTREQFGALARLGEPVVFITASQLPYLRTLAAPLKPLKLPSAADRAKDRVEALRTEIAQLLETGNVDAELAMLDPLFERFDPAEVAAAVLAIGRQSSAVSQTPAPSTISHEAAAWVTVFVNVGKKDRAGAKDLVGALIKEVNVQKGQIGRIDVRETFSVVEVAPPVAAQVVRELTGVTIKGRRVQARLDRHA